MKSKGRGQVPPRPPSPRLLPKGNLDLSPNCLAAAKTRPKGVGAAPRHLSTTGTCPRDARCGLPLRVRSGSGPLHPRDFRPSGIAASRGPPAQMGKLRLGGASTGARGPQTLLGGSARRRRSGRRPRTGRLLGAAGVARWKERPPREGPGGSHAFRAGVRRDAAATRPSGPGGRARDTHPAHPRTPGAQPSPTARPGSRALTAGGLPLSGAPGQYAGPHH